MKHIINEIVRIIEEIEKNTDAKESLRKLRVIKKKVRNIKREDIQSMLLSKLDKAIKNKESSPTSCETR